VHLLPDLVSPEALAGQAVVVIDCLRATTTITHAIASGARAVIPCLEIDEARQRAAQFAAGEAALGGERQGIKIEGFDLGNSPTEYTRGSVGGKTVVFTTTNGTRAMMRCQQARRVLIGALVNRRAVVEALRHESVIHIVCAGTRGEITGEDVLTAGAIVSGIIHAHGSWQRNDEARIALAAWQAVEMKDLITTLNETQGGRNLVAEGFDADIATCARLDTINVAPELDVKSWTIREVRP
jgi:2-phosphosulfolactate phosphatase